MPGSKGMTRDIEGSGFRADVSGELLGYQNGKWRESVQLEIAERIGTVWASGHRGSWSEFEGLGSGPGV